MISKITDKFQTTLPKEIRDKLKLSRKDTLVWTLDEDKIIIEINKKSILDLKGAIKTGSGNIKEDIQEMRELISQKILTKK